MDTIAITLAIVTPIVSIVTASLVAAWKTGKHVADFENRLALREREGVTRLTCAEHRAQSTAAMTALLDSKLDNIYGRLDDIKDSMSSALSSFATKIDERLRAVEQAVAEMKGAQRA